MLDCLATLLYGLAPKPQLLVLEIIGKHAKEGFKVVFEVQKQGNN